MSDIRDHIEVLLSRFGRLIYRRSWLFLILSVLAVGAMGAQLPHIQMDISAEGLLHKEDPALKTYEEFRRQFGRDQMVILGVQPPEIFDRPFLEKFQKFHNALETQVPNLYEIRSLANVPYIGGQDDEIIVTDLLEEIPANVSDMSSFREKVLNHPLYPGSIISNDGQFTIITLKPVVYSPGIPSSDNNEVSRKEKFSEEEQGQFIDSIQEVCTEFESPDFRIYFGGDMTAEVVLTRMTVDTMSRFTLLTSLFIVLLTAILFRRISGVIFPLLTVNCALYSTLGLMAILDVSITLNTTILPSFLLAVGIGDSVHILAMFYRHFDTTQNKEEAIAFALGHSGLAVIMTSLTTAGGLLSFVSAGIEPVAQLGIFAAVGVMLALFFSLVTLPALLGATPLKNKKGREAGSSFSKLDTLLAAVGDFATKHPWPVILCSIVVLLSSLALSLQLNFSHNSLLYLDEKAPVRQATETIDRHMKGSLNVEILLDSGEENGLFEPAVMKDIETIQRAAGELRISSIQVGKAVSIAETIKDVNRALHGGELYELPKTKELIAQELLLYEIGGGEDLRTMVGDRYQQSRITVNVPWLDAVEYSRVLTVFEENIRGLIHSDSTVTITGIVVIICRTFANIIQTMATSYLIAGLVISILMILLIGDLRLGLVSMVPNFLPIILGLAFMQLVGIPLDYSTIMVGGIAIGLAVDDTVHFMHNFRRYFARTGDAREAVRQTLTTAGRAMLFTTLILCSGFFILLFAELKSTVNFGLITGFTISMALLADFLLAPALMMLVTNVKKNKSRLSS